MNRRLLWIGALGLVGITSVLVRRSAERATPPRIEDPIVATPSSATEEPALLEEIEHARTGTSRSEARPAQAPAVVQATPKPIAQPLVLDGRVVDDLGQPVSGIEVMTRRLGERSTRTEGSRRRDLRELLDERIDVAFSSLDGSFRVEGLEPGEWELVASSGKRRSAPVAVTMPDERGATTLVLSRAAAVAGIVVDASGRPVTSAEVHLVLAGEGHEYFGILGRPETRTRTDSVGSFRIENVQSGKVHLMASQAETESSWVEIVLPPGGVRADVRIELIAGGRIEGWLDPSLDPIARREISLNSFDGTSGWRRTETDESGRFVLDGVIPQAYCISLRQTTTTEEVVAGEAHIVTTTSGQIRKNVVVVAGETVQVVFGGPEATILVRGTITSAGQPVPDAEVGAAPVDGIEETGSRARTTVDGSYELSVPRAGDYRFDVSVDHGSFAYFARTVPAVDLVELSFSVPSGAISGQVVGSDGQPLSRVPITAVLESDGKDFYGDCYRRMHTENDGTFAFRLLAPGSYTLRAPDGFQSDSPPPRVAFGRVVLSDLTVNEHTQLANVELRLPPEGRVSGTVVDGIGAPVPDAWIYLIDERGWPISGDWEARTDSSGHFLIESVAPGVHTAWVQTMETETESSPFQCEAGKTASIRVELR